MLKNQISGIAQPHVGAVGKAGYTQQHIELSRLCLLQHTAGELGIEFRDCHCAGRAKHLVVLKAQLLRGGKQGHGGLVVQRNFAGIYSRQVLQHPDHGRVVVAQHIQLEQVAFHGVVFKVGGNDICIGVVGGVLDRAEIVNFLVLGNDHHAAGMLAAGLFHPGTAQN